MIGRTKEQERLLTCYRSDKSEFVVVYGRRRVGKTYLIRETFNNDFFFSFTGTTAIKTAAGQLERFASALATYGIASASRQKIKTWNDAFDLLTHHIRLSDPTMRKVIFFDEMPWLDTPKSGFIGALEYFWNAFASARKDIVFIACGSAASWISKKLLKERGGLHNRVTARILLNPFTLKECEEFLRAKGTNYARYDIIECYMVFGGIPYYLDYIDGRYSIAANVDRMVFANDAPLANEFEELYESLFGSAEPYLATVLALGNARIGLTRDDILKAIKYPDGSTVTNMLNNLELSGFIRRYNAFPKKKRGSLYQLVDNFSLFWLAFLHKARPTSPNYRTELRNTPLLNSWRGYAFEVVCLKHISQIQKGLGISGVLTWVSAWRSSNAKKGAQIDLVIEREDRVINLCEIKYSQSEFAISQEYAQKLKDRLDAFAEQTGTTKTLFLTMITTYGVKRNQYASLIRNELTMDALFES
jgi:AAA+ ATPase superfamily predicted ATPase